MADIPSSSPAEAARKSGDLLKKIPKWGWFAIAGLMFLIILYLRHRSSVAAGADSTQNSSATADQASTDASNYGSDTSGLDSAYLSGYDSGLYSTGGVAGSSLPTDIFGGAGFNQGGAASSPAGADGSTAPAPQPQPINVTVTNSPVQTGGGPPVKPADVHTTPSVRSSGSVKVGAGGERQPKLKKGQVWAPFGSKKPPNRKGYKTVGLGGGYWAYQKA